ncbi:MAG TPA: hypothetical protein PLY40_01260 [Bacillota bacterium]|nr:hypothetical protein [Bacillota bacterium]
MASEHNTHYHGNITGNGNGNPAELTHNHRHPCPQTRGTLFRIFIPAGTVINLLNVLELTSPSGICLILRIPLLQDKHAAVQALFDAVKQAGGTVEAV